MECTIGFEKVIVGTIAYKFMLVAPILARTILGKDLKSITENEKIRHAPSNGVIHIAFTE